MIIPFFGVEPEISLKSKKRKEKANTNRISLERASLNPANLEYAISLNISKSEKINQYLNREIS